MAAEYLERMGDRMRNAREAKGLSQSALARLLPGTTDGNQVSRWELGKHRPSDDTLEAIAQALDVDVTFFLAAQADKSDGTPDLFVGPDDISKRLDRIEQMLEEAATERQAIRALLKEQEAILNEMRRVAGSFPDDEALRLLNEGARQIAEAAEAYEAAPAEKSAARAGTRRRRAAGQ